MGENTTKIPKYRLTQQREYFESGAFQQAVNEFQTYGQLRTGYKSLDRIQPFYPGLYCLGGISSLGKTTFAAQLAEQVAAQGQWVLYFSLEQTELELISKSLARGFYRTNRYQTFTQNAPSTYPTPTSMDIRCGAVAQQHPAELQEQIDYSMSLVDNRLCIIYSAFSLTVEDIIAMTAEFCRKSGERPGLIVIDYLQIIAPSVIGGRPITDTKTNIDHIVHSLKTYQADNNYTVLALSSLNRANYMAPIDFESFKESGGIEYTADVIWGLQLSVLNDSSFYSKTVGNKTVETSIKDKRERIAAEKAKNPRSIDLVCLKNRYGISSYSCPFEYYPAHDYFKMPFDKNDPDTYY